MKDLKSNNNYKISILGDIMCEYPFLAASNGGKEYRFDEAFEGLNEAIENSHFIIGNLETPLSSYGSDYSRKKEVFSFCTPRSFAESLKRLGISLVLTANNHCYDRGEEGLYRTIRILDEIGLPHTGTFLKGEHPKPYYIKCNDLIISVISCTASTNPGITKEEPYKEIVNIIRPQNIIKNEKTNSKWNRIKKALAYSFIKVFGYYYYFLLKKRLGLKPTKSYQDDDYNEKKDDPYIDSICKQILTAKKLSDIVIVCPHMGGQFNSDPGEFSRYAMNRLSKAGADAIIASHPHVIQRFEIINKVPCTYSLGNVSMSLSTPYFIHDNHPEYGIIEHLYIEGKTIKKITGTIIRIMEDDDGYIRVKTLHDIYKKADSDEKKAIEKDFIFALERLNIPYDDIIKDIPLEFDLMNTESECTTAFIG